MKNKIGEMGVGTLIIFIAMLLVAAVAAGVLIQTIGSLQETSFMTGMLATNQISTNAQVIEISATDGRNGNLTDFQQIMTLSPGSDPIKLDQVLFSFNTKDSTATLRYRGINSLCEHNNDKGYNTWEIEEINSDVTNSSIYILAEDLDDDRDSDSVTVGETIGGITYMSVNISDYGVANVSLGINITSSGSFNREIDISMSPIMLGDDVYGYLTIYGNTTINNTIPSNIVFRVTPYHVNEGYFTAVYEQEGTNHIDGNLQPGDIIRLCYEAPGEVVDDEAIRLNFIPKIGTPTLTEFVTPDVISIERIYLYP
jgi:archaeal flagellin FlaB